MERRSFLRGFAATLLAAAVAPETGLALPSDDYERLKFLLTNGVPVTNRKFVFHNAPPIVVDRPVRIERCIFQWTGKQPPLLLDFGSHGHAYITHSVFDTSRCERAADEDWTFMRIQPGEYGQRRPFVDYFPLPPVDHPVVLPSL